MATDALRTFSVHDSHYRTNEFPARLHREVEDIQVASRGKDHKAAFAPEVMVHRFKNVTAVASAARFDHE